MTSARFGVLLLAAGLAGCAGLVPPEWFGLQPPAQPGPEEYPAMGFSSAFDAASPGGRARVRVLFDSIEDTVLDLPEDYANGWLRAVVADQERSDKRSSNVVLPEGNRRYLSELPRGQDLDLFVSRVVHQDSMLSSGAPTVILRVEKLRKHIDQPAPASRPAAAVPAPAVAAAEPPPVPKDAPLLYGNARSADDVLKLLPDGRFELRQRGKDIAGAYELKGPQLIFILPDGRRAQARRAGETLADPDGKQWILKKPTQ